MPKCSRNRTHHGAHKQMFAMSVTAFRSGAFSIDVPAGARKRFSKHTHPAFDIGDPLMQRRAVQVSSECFDFGAALASRLRLHLVQVMSAGDWISFCDFVNGVGSRRGV